MSATLRKRLDALEKNQPDKGRLFAQDMQRMFGILRIKEALDGGHEGLRQLLNDGYIRLMNDRGKEAADGWVQSMRRVAADWQGRR